MVSIILLTIIKIVPKKKQILLYERDMMIKFCTVHPYDLNVLFNTVNVLKTLRNRIRKSKLWSKIKSRICVVLGEVTVWH